MNDGSRACSAITRDVLVTIVGAARAPSRACLKLSPSTWVCQGVALLRPRADVLDRRYLELFLAAPNSGQRAFGHLMYGQRRPHVAAQIVERLGAALERFESVPQSSRTAAAAR